VQLFCFVAVLLTLGPTAPKVQSPSHGDPEADRILSRARDVWQQRTEAPYVSYGVKLQITKGERHWDNWWEASYRRSDGRLAVARIVIPGDEEQRLKGTPLKLQAFGLKIFDTNPNAEPIIVGDPAIRPLESFGLLRPPNQLAEPESPEVPSPQETALAEVGRVQVNARDYSVELVTDDADTDADSYHLRLTPTHDPTRLRLRELWVSKDTYVTRRLVVQGIYDGDPYDKIRWMVTYVEINNRLYVQQIKNQQTLHFGIQSLPEMEFDYVDYRFPATIPHYRFQHPI
jgi:hypothetical protein